MSNVGSDDLLERLTTIHERIASACARAGRSAGSVRLVAAAKGVGVDTLRAAVAAGVTDVGENYVQELGAMRAAVEGVTWHFIGTLQSGTATHVAELADVVETVVPGRAADRLARRAAGYGRELPVLLEVDFAQRGTGVPPERVEEAADALGSTEGLRLWGLMTLPPMPQIADEARPFFRRLRELRDGLVERHPHARELSMGMSLDYEVAIEEGATMVRIGTALFGARPPVDPGPVARAG